MSLPVKEVRCSCGNVLKMTKKSDWCTKCAGKVFYEKKDQWKHKVSTIWLIGVVLAVFTFLVYVFIELIAEPLSKL